MRKIGQGSKEFSRELKRLRYSVYLTQTEFCRRAEIPLSTYKAWECGTQFPTPANWKKYIAFMDERSGLVATKNIKAIYISYKGA